MKKYISLTSLLKTSLMSLSMASGIYGAQAKDYNTPSYLEGCTRAWGDISYDDDPWVFNVSRPYFITQGLQNRHIALWASHGRYYDNDKHGWKWQRPNLFCTNEDLFTQTIVVPFLMPMLENAGAIVFTPRERDWQTNEVIVDNDDPIKTPYYRETTNGKKWTDCDSLGFAAHRRIYIDGQNPFREGTTRQAKATKKKKKYSEISYQPRIPEAGRYAVYVSYQSLPKSVGDAHYIVYHKGQATEFTINQKMGGGTWVYLGTFNFDKGCNEFNRVVCTNRASKKGIVTSDAVRFGGGMGNIARGGYTSGLPRCLEGARYFAQWAGTPYYIYSGRKGTNDYADDINVRSLMSNWLGGGSIYMPTTEGKGVPLELSLAIHSDAGYNPDGKTPWGPLAICTTNFNDGRLGCGISRMTSKDFAKALLRNLATDIRSQYGYFPERYLWDRNYSETRLPEVPSAIIETLSHQSFPDMRLAQDPMFKFTMARSLYKTILRYVASNHGVPYTVQPLPPQHFAVTQDNKGNAMLSWMPQDDKTEPTAKPTAYIIYTAEGHADFDNGTIVQGTSHRIALEPGKLYQFKVSALNKGGESFPSETLAALYCPMAKKTVLVVNNFHRLAAPQVIDNDSVQGFDMDADPGVSYGLYAGWGGKQKVFDRTRMGIEGENGLGYSEDKMAGNFVAGNTFSYVTEHAQSIASTGKYNVVSCSSEAILTGKVGMGNYPVVDLINGLERYDGYTPEFYKAFTPRMQSLIKAYLQEKGALLVSGSYLGSDMQTGTEPQFLSQMLHTEYQVCDSLRPTAEVEGLGLQFRYHQSLNAKHYAATHPEILRSSEEAICAMRYASGASAAVAYKGANSRTFTMGFPFECITEEPLRNRIMAGILKFLAE